MWKMRQKEMRWEMMAHWHYLSRFSSYLQEVIFSWEFLSAISMNHYANFPVKVHQVLWDLFVFLNWQEKDWFSCQSLFFDHLRIQTFPRPSSSFLRLARHMSFAQSLARKADEVEAKRKEAEMRMDAEEAARIRIWVPRLQKINSTRCYMFPTQTPFLWKRAFPSRFFSVSTIYRVQFRKMA